MALRPPSRVLTAFISFLALSLIAAAALPSASAQQKVALRFWMSADPALEAAMDALLQEYMKTNPTIAVQRDAFPFNEYHQKLATAFAAGQPTDAFWMVVLTPAFAAPGSLPVLVRHLTPPNQDAIILSRLIVPVLKRPLFRLPVHEH